MKILLLVSLIFLVFTPIFGQLSDRTGLVTRLNIETSGHIFEIESVSNYDVRDFEFIREEKRLTLFITSGIENNLGELIIPKELLSGNLTFSLNDDKYFPKYHSNEKISFVTLNFTGIGENKLDIYASNVLPGFEVEETNFPEDNQLKNAGGCLIATATYGTELSKQVQHLREIRDSKLLKTSHGSSFMEFFNAVYYFISPYVADYERENPVFKEIVKTVITPLLFTLSFMDYAESENDVTTIGIGLIMLNMGIYLILPASLLFRIKKYLK